MSIFRLGKFNQEGWGINILTSSVSIIPRLFSMYSFSSCGILGCSDGDSLPMKKNRILEIIAIQPQT